jgi:hypothetical protein
MAAPPALTAEAKTILRLVLERKIIRGGELMRFAGLKNADELVSPVKELMSEGLIQVTGDISDDMIPFATFGTRPSDQSYLRFVLDPAR